MDKFLDELTIEDLKGETQELAETIGLDAFKRLVQAYNGTGRLYIPQLSRITAPIRDRHIYEDHKHGGLDVPKLALKYALTDAYTRQIIKERERIEKRAVRPVSYTHLDVYKRQGSWNGMNPRFPHVRFAEAPASCAEDGHTVTRAYRQHAPNAGAVQGYM